MRARGISAACAVLLLLAPALLSGCNSNNLDYRYVEAGLFPKALILLWPAVTLLMFHTFRAPTAALLSVLVGTLFLPERIEFDLPLLPPISKHSLPTFAALLGLMWKAPRRMRPHRGDRTVLFFLGLLAIGAVGTVLTNPEALITGPITRPGLSPYDTVSMFIRELLAVVIPFWVGRALVVEPAEAHAHARTLTRIFLMYTLLMLFEVRMSPQLHNLLYGYHAHSFAQTIRWGGYRPTVFLEHGLAVGTFALAGFFLVLANLRAKRAFVPLPSVVIVAYTAFVLVVVKSTGAILVGLVFAPLIAVMSPKRLSLAAAFISVVILAYPLSKVSGAFPGETLVNWALELNEDRASSLEDRFEQDEQLVDRALLKPTFGWGTFSRNRVFSADGEDLSVTDGYWIIQLGTRGIVGLFAALLLMLYPVFRARKTVRLLQDRALSFVLVGLLFIQVAYVLDLLPNGMYNVFPFLFAGWIHGMNNAAPGWWHRAHATPPAQGHA